MNIVGVHNRSTTLIEINRRAETTQCRSQPRFLTGPETSNNSGVIEARGTFKTNFYRSYLLVYSEILRVGKADFLIIGSSKSTVHCTSFCLSACAPNHLRIMIQISTLFTAYLATGSPTSSERKQDNKVLEPDIAAWADTINFHREDPDVAG